MVEFQLNYSKWSWTPPSLQSGQVHVFILGVSSVFFHLYFPVCEQSRPWSYVLLRSLFWGSMKHKPQHDKTNKMTYAPSENSDQPGRPSSLIRVFACAQWVADPPFLHADIEDYDHIGRMPRLIWVFAGRTCHFVGLVMLRLIYCHVNILHQLYDKPSKRTEGKK